MANRGMMAKWIRSKKIKRRTQPKAFAQKATAGLNKHSRKTDATFNKQEAIFRHNDRVVGAAEKAMRRLEHFIKVHKPHHTILYDLFTPVIKQTSEKIFLDEIVKHPDVWKYGIKIHRNGYIEETLEDITPPPKAGLHPFMAVELLLAQYIAQDQSLRVFEFDVVSLGHSDYHDIWMFFRGQECFIVFRRDREVFQSIMYKNPMWLKDFAVRSLKKVEWAGEPVILDHLEPNSS